MSEQSAFGQDEQSVLERNEMLDETRRLCAEMIAETERRCSEMLADAQRKAHDLVCAASSGSQSTAEPTAATVDHDILMEIADRLASMGAAYRDAMTEARHVVQALRR